MKILILILVFLLSACSGPNNGSGSRTSVASPPPTEDTQDAPSYEPDPPADIEPPAEIVLAEASTPLLDDGEARVSNINLACGAVSGAAIYPGGTFSFNDTVGHRTEEKGYRDAPVLVNGHKEQGCGGGVCQVSSTIYSAALDAGLQIDERHAHTHGVAYAEPGRDATVVSGEKDLRFTNNTNAIVTVYVWCDGEAVFSKITKKALDKPVM